MIIVAPDILKTYAQDGYDVIISSSAYDIIREQLISSGFSDHHIWLYNFAFMDLEYSDMFFIKDHLDDFERAYDRMSDDKSKRIMVGLLNYKISKDESFLKELQNDVDDEYYQYFDEELFSFDSEEVFLDIGAYVGDTFRVFNDVYAGHWKRYIGLEADKKVYTELQQTINEYNVADRSHLFNIAAWDSEERLFISCNPGSSHVETQMNVDFVQGICVDDLLIDTDVSFVKMDIEGAEYNAIMGMKTIIKKCSPILAISVYHLRDDYYRLTDLVEGIAPNQYRYYMRQYRYTPTETVCYAIPTTRMKATAQ